MIGDKKQAQEVKGRNLQLLDTAEDVAWAVDVHIAEVVKHHPDKFPSLAGLDLKKEIKGIVITGNEDSPDELHIALEFPVLRTSAVYEIIGK